jgi:hypothetical protein
MLSGLKSVCSSVSLGLACGSTAGHRHLARRPARQRGRRRRPGRPTRRRNLTDKALALNLEAGVILRDPGVVHWLVSHFCSLMKSGTGPLERVLD